MPEHPGLPSVSGRKVILIPLLIEELLQTKGDANNVKRYVDVGPVSRLGPMIEKMRVHWEGTDFTANFVGEVDTEWSVSGQTWSPNFQLLGNQTSDGQTIGAYYTTDTNFGLNLRFTVECRNATGTAVEAGIVTAWLEVVLKS